MAPRVWFITGASSGFGRYITELALKKDDNVVATLRKPEVLDDLASQYPTSRLLVIKLDVRVEQQIVDAFAKAREVFGRLDVVFNNAGHSMASEVEGTPQDMAHDLFETNFWGAVNVSRNAVKFFREVNPPGVGGRLLQVSSIVGIGAMPIVGFYSASKQAFEGITEALALEVDPKWNIKITLIEPGAFRTAATTPKGNMKKVAAHPAYTDANMMACMFRQGIEHMEIDGDPEKAVRAMYRLSEVQNPPFRLPLGKDCIETARRKIASLTADTDMAESWSHDLKFD